MEIIRFGQTVMSERLRCVTRPLETFKQTDLERLLFRLAANRSQEPLHLFSLREIADLVAKAQNEFAILTEFFRIRILMNPVNRGNGSVPQLARDRLVRGQHEFFNQLMRFVVLDPLQTNWPAVCINMHFYFRKIEIERAMLESLAAQQ